MITNYKHFINEEFNQVIYDCNKDIVKIMKKTNYIVQYHSNIYQSTLIKKKDLISSAYEDFEFKYEDILCKDVYSFKYVSKPETYASEYFLYPVVLLEKLKNKKVINYQELPFYDELFKVLDYYNINIDLEKFNI